MDGQEVIVHDLEYDAYDQICLVKVKNRPEITKSRKTTKVKVLASEIQLENEEYLYKYDLFGKCINGEFKVFSKIR